ncbi:MAG TPA: hypothetical protein VEL76_09480, partial [Gemmataceae bacterium]|nr:hypothetical protein [Gemmataceae bacterium]
MLAGVGVIAVFSLPPRVSLPEEGLPRCLWSTIQLGIGILMILAAQLWALLVLADTDERLSYKDAIFSGRLWGLTLWKLPATRQQLWLGAWGIAAILSALFLIGGLSHWFTYLPRSATAEPAAVEQETK